LPKLKGDIRILKMPITKGGGARFRGPTSSNEYNTNEDNKYLDLVELYRQSNENTQTLLEAYQVALGENVALNNYVNMIENRLLELEKRQESLAGNNWYNGQFFKTSFVDSMTTRYPNAAQDDSIKTPRCNIDNQYRYVTIPLIHQIPKTHAIGKNQEVILPKELELLIGRTNKQGRVKENNIANAFNGENESFWKREVIYSYADAPDEEDVIIEVGLPLSLVNNLNINTIQIHPHPERGVQIKNVEIHYNNTWEQVKGFAQNDISSIHSEEYSPRKKWYFPNKPVQKVRITMVQKNPLDIDGNKVFVIGAQEIGVYLSVFEPSGGMVLTPFDMSNVGVYSIENIEHVFLNRKAFSYPENMNHMLENNIYTYDVLVENGGMLVPISNEEWSNQTAKKIWIKSYLHPDPESGNGVNPCLHAVRLHYTKT
jgi:hypothetical protein